ncbi:ATPase [Alsobacter soli]|uniref:histidine kinase n=1 Tax=Alsobacter soli TaxID=2109933 RepID=A0A2T1HP30_9HYPH|nr:ATP-binding protein [Alsobacter soli]PSC03383.1 ATPase [Alsobacter soli]
MGEALNDPMLDSCAREPIRTPGSIQPHGALFALTPGEWRLAQASANADRVLNCSVESALGQPISAVLADGADDIAAVLAGGGEFPPSRVLRIAGVDYHPVSHWSGGVMILELEESARGANVRLEDAYGDVRRFAQEMQDSHDERDVAQSAADTVRRITGFDRALIYRFDENWNGVVLGESRNDALPSYLHLRFPASDIPAQARELYRLNRVRQIPNAAYDPAPILRAPGVASPEPLDLSYSVLRSVSPVHLEYMRNMGTAASMSISIVVNGRLWGLISCHSAEPRRAPQPVRTACDFIGQIMAMRLAGLDLYAEASERVRLQSVHARLLTAMALAPNLLVGLTQDGGALLDLTGAAGASVVSDMEVRSVGQTPDDRAVRAIAGRLSSLTEDGVYVTESLARDIPEAAEHRDSASGLLAISISQIHPSYVLWFRPEVIRTVHWAGEPAKTREPGSERLSPRKSFESWKETVRLTADPWSQPAVDAARALRTSVVDIVLRKAEQMAELTGELEKSNKELEAFSYSVSHDLRAPFRHIVGYAELLRERLSGTLDDKGAHYLETIIQSAFSAGRLVDDLLSFSQAGRVTLHPVRVDMGKLVEEVRRLLSPQTAGRSIEWKISKLPPVHGDPSLLRQVWQNLISNAVKYTSGRETALIEISAEKKANETLFTVRDNGVGFDMTYVGKLFGVFQRLHRAEEFEGTGIGLANVRRMVERHGGRVWAEGVLDQGATFHFTLPNPEAR